MERALAAGHWVAPREQLFLPAFRSGHSLLGSLSGSSLISSANDFWACAPGLGRERAPMGSLGPGRGPLFFLPSTSSSNAAHPRDRLAAATVKERYFIAVQEFIKHEGGWFCELPQKTSIVSFPQPTLFRGGKWRLPDPPSNVRYRGRPSSSLLQGCLFGIHLFFKSPLMPKITPKT